MINDESEDIKPYLALNEFDSIFNPKMVHDIKHFIYFDTLNQMSFFEQADYT